MANYRQIHVHIWKDEWFLDLEPSAKILFIYLFSNENTSLSGLYKLPIRVIEFETGLSRKYITATLELFAQAGKVYFQDGIVWMVNMRRYHETKSDKVLTRINKDIASIPDCDIKRRYLASYIPYGYPMDTRPQLKEEEDEKEKEKEDENKEEKELSVQRVAEQLTGLMVTHGDVETLNAWERDGVTEADIRDALQWRVDNGRPPVKTISQLAGGVSTSRSKRVQGASAKGNGKGAARAISTPESFKESEYAGWYADIEDEQEARAT